MSQSDFTTSSSSSSSDDDSTNEEEEASTASLTDVLSATTSSSSQVRNTQLVNCECVHVGDVVHINAPIVLTADLKTLNKPSKPGAERQGINARGLDVCIVTREAWQAEQPVSKSCPPLSRPLQRVIVTATDTEPSSSMNANVSQVRYLQRCHIKQRGLGDIPFNFLVGGDGNVYEGRGWTMACSDDTTGLHVALIGTFQVENPSRRQQRALQGLLQMAVARGTLAKNYQLLVFHPLLDTITRHWSKPEDIEVVSREEWGAIDPEHTYFLTDQLTYVIISHSVFQLCSSSKEENMEYIRYIQNVHAHERGWGDIAYNFLIGGDGRVYEGRGWHAKGSHTYAYNHLALGVCFVGDFRVEQPSEVQLQACQKLLRIAVARGQLAPHYKLVGHCQVRNTASPGQALMEVIKTWPHWSSQL